MVNLTDHAYLGGKETTYLLLNKYEKPPLYDNFSLIVNGDLFSNRRIEPGDTTHHQNLLYAPHIRPTCVNQWNYFLNVLETKFLIG